MEGATGQKSLNKAYEVVILKTVALVGNLLSGPNRVEYFNPT